MCTERNRGCAFVRTPWTNPPNVQATATRDTSAIDARMFRMSQPPTRSRKRHVTVWLAATLAGLSACTPTLEASVARAQARIQAACGLRPEPSSVTWVQGYVQCGGTAEALGCARTPDGQVRISTLAREDQLDQVVTHELLHLIGAVHVPAGHGIMAASASAAIDRVTAEDLAPCGCPWVREE